jgi:hypothetical protein
MFYDDIDEYDERFYIGRMVEFKDGSQGNIVDIELNNIPCCAMLVTLLIEIETKIVKIESNKFRFIRDSFFEI